MNKYHEILSKIVAKGKEQRNKKGAIKYLLNQSLELKPIDLLVLFESHGLAKKKLKDELGLFWLANAARKLIEAWGSRGGIIAVLSW